MDDGSTFHPTAPGAGKCGRSPLMAARQFSLPGRVETTRSNLRIRSSSIMRKSEYRPRFGGFLWAAGKSSRCSISRAQKPGPIRALSAGGIFFLTQPDDSVFEGRTLSSILFFDFKTRTSTKIAEVRGDILISTPGLAISPDGRFLLYPQIDESAGDLILLNNFK